MSCGESGGQAPGLKGPRDPWGREQILFILGGMKNPGGSPPRKEREWISLLLEGYGATGGRQKGPGR